MREQILRNDDLLGFGLGEVGDLLVGFLDLLRRVESARPFGDEKGLEVVLSRHVPVILDDGDSFEVPRSVEGVEPSLHLVGEDHEGGGERKLLGVESKSVKRVRVGLSPPSSMLSLGY